MFEVGAYIVHPGQGVCRVEGVGEGPDATYKLLPLGQRHPVHISYPVASEGRLRRVLSAQEARRRAELVVDVQSDIIDAYNESVLGTEREVLCEGFDSQAQMHFGRSYAESPDIDGRIWFDADREVEPGTFVTVRLTGVMDGELTGELAEE